MTAATKYGSLWKLHCRDNSVCQARFHWREADALREEVGKCTGEETAGHGSKRLHKGSRDNVGKGRPPVGSDDNLQRPGAKGNRSPRRRAVWRMSPYERRRRSNVLQGVP